MKTFLILVFGAIFIFSLYVSRKLSQRIKHDEFDDEYEYVSTTSKKFADEYRNDGYELVDIYYDDIFDVDVYRLRRKR